jgi:hypothetical protein
MARPDYTRLALAAFTLAAVACDGGGERPVTETDDAGSAPAEDAASEGAEDAGVDGGSGETAFLLTDWVHALVEERSSDEAEPDTVDDKRIIDTDDPSAFDTYL